MHTSWGVVLALVNSDQISPRKRELIFQRALQIALDDCGVDKLRMLCWLVHDAEETEAVSIAVSKHMFKLSQQDNTRR
jgi:uncharacterized protein Smg (DUF494 family)